MDTLCKVAEFCKVQLAIKTKFVNWLLISYGKYFPQFDPVPLDSHQPLEAGKYFTFGGPFY